MKQNLLTLVFSLIAISSIAQVNFGLKGGLNISKSKQTADNVSPEFDNIIGFNAGFYFSKQVKEKIALQYEIFASRDGAKYNDTEDLSFIGATGEFSYEEKYLFLNFPILLKFSPEPKLSLYIGPQIGATLMAKYKAKVTIRYNNGGTETDEEEEDLEDFAKFNLAGCLGIGYQVTDDLELAFRFTNTLTNLYTGKEDGKIEVRSLQFSLNIRLNNNQ